VYLPALGGVARPSPAAPAGVASPNGHETVLVCEDDETVRGLVCQALEAHGYTVLATTEPARALELAAGYDGPIHLLITDVIMTAMNGRQLARALQSQRPGMKVLFVSGYTSDVIAHHGVLDPGIEFLAKPFRSSDLLGRVREVLDRQPSNVAV
jgi:DNA-binding response OmpR family regulator